MDDFAHPEYLVSTEWLADHLDDPDVRVLDVTGKLSSDLVNRARPSTYDVGHIPDSIFFDVASAKGVLSDQAAALPWMWPGTDEFENAMREHGVGPGTKVVLAARTPRLGVDSGTMWCTRAWWTMHHMGVDCSILHGGIERWEDEGRPMVTSRSVVPACPAVSVPAGWERGRATRHDVLAATTSPTCIVDALPAESFDGSGAAYGPRSGHIAGAVNVPFRTLIEAETAAFVGPAEMRSTLSAAGLFDRESVITYCGGAIAATVDAFCLALCGHEAVAVYDGSLMEWSADPDLPME